MKIGTVIVLIGIATITGYFVGARHQTQFSAPLIDTTVRAGTSDLDRSVARVTTAVSEATPRLPSPQDPRVAAEEEVEAMRRGDVSAVARSIVLTAEAKTLLESAVASAPPELAREYPTPELLAAFVFCGAQRIEGFRIESTTFEQPDRATQHIAYKFASERDWRTEEIAFMRVPEGWHRVVDGSLAQRIAAIVGIRKQ